jgi:hypothetical protein
MILQQLIFLYNVIKQPTSKYMKAKTIKRHVVVLDDSEVKMIYHALMLLETQKAAVGSESKEQLETLKKSFYDLIKSTSVSLRRKMEY